VVPSDVLVAVYVWHLVVLPTVLLSFFVATTFSTITAVARQLRPMRHRRSAGAPAEPASVAVPALAVSPSRRQFIATALVAAGPPLLQVAGVTTATLQMGQFRVRRFDIGYKNLPAALEGVTIAHLSDTHLGRFTTRADVRHIIDATNRLDADVVAFTGDLIDFDIEQLPAGIELLKGLRPRSGIVMIEGNHDLFQDRAGFERGVKNAGFPLLLNESHVLRVGAAGYPMNFLGLQWGSPALRRDPMLQEWSQKTLAQRNPDAFNVLLAHHPHGFDYAAETGGVPLTLAGHTHGGQLMLTPGVGPGPLMYRYWSGLYRHRANPDAACVVSNGIGNWFPLRINAPAEIVHMTLRNA
jgi:predicted MPP superfamily phosphohydrolase